MELQAGKRYLTADGRETTELSEYPRGSCEQVSFHGCIVGSPRSGVWLSDGRHIVGEAGLNLVAEAPDKPSLKSPVSTETRTVTEVKIVPGVYGPIEVFDLPGDKGVAVNIRGGAGKTRIRVTNNSQALCVELTADELEHAAFVLTELAHGIRAKEAENA